MKTIILCLFLLFFTNLYSQPPSAITPMVDNSSVDQYVNYTKEFSNLFYGRIYVPQTKALFNRPYNPFLLPFNSKLTINSETTIFRLSDYYSEGRLIYNGVVYPKETMLLDLFLNELVIHTPNNFNIILDPYKVEMVELQGYHVFYMKPNNLKDNPIEGYYLLLEKNDYCSFIRKDIYNIIRPTSDAALECTTKYYLFIDDKYHQVKGKGSVLKAFSDKKKELNTFIKDNKLSFNEPHRELSIKQIVKQYEKLKK